MLITAVVRFAVVEHRLLASAPEDPPGIKIVQWTIGEGSRVPYAAIADQVVGMDPDVAILTNAPWIGGEAALRDWVEGEGARRLRSQPFEIIVRRPLIEMRGLVSPDVRRPTPALVRLVVAAPDLPDGRLVLALVDLESDPRRPRHEIADEAIALFTEAWEGPPPDVVIGDFNMQRGSASMRRIVDALMPGPTRHVQAEGGHGYAATWSEGFPLWHIDHAWIGPDVACVRYDTPLITAWRHYPQVLWLVPRPEVAADAG